MNALRPVWTRGRLASWKWKQKCWWHHQAGTLVLWWQIQSCLSALQKRPSLMSSYHIATKHRTLQLGRRLSRPWLGRSCRPSLRISGPAPCPLSPAWSATTRWWQLPSSAVSGAVQVLAWLPGAVSEAPRGLRGISEKPFGWLIFGLCFFNPHLLRIIDISVMGATLT